MNCILTTTAIVSPLKDFSARQRACPVRCSQHPRRGYRSVPHRQPSRKSSCTAPFNRVLTTVQKISGYLPKDDGIKAALTGADIVIIPAGIPRKPGMTRDDLFKINAGIVKGLIEAVAKYCPKAFVLVISNPVNSTVPIAAETLKAAGVFDAKRLFGVTTLDVVRAQTFVSEITGEKNPASQVIPVIGGHSGETIVPIFSQAKPPVNISGDALDKLTYRTCSLLPLPSLTRYRCPIRRRRSRQSKGWSRFRYPLHGVGRLHLCRQAPPCRKR